MKLKNIFKILLLIILSGFVSSIFVFRELNKDYNYKHTITLKNSYYEPVLYESGESPNLKMYAEFTFEIITDSKKEIKNYNQLSSALSSLTTNIYTNEYCVFSGSGYGDNRNNGDYFPIDYIMYLDIGDEVIIWGLLRVYTDEETHISNYVPYNLVKDGGFNDSLDLYSTLEFTDKVSKTTKNVSTSLNINDINLLLD